MKNKIIKFFKDIFLGFKIAADRMIIKGIYYGTQHVLNSTNDAV
jgi:hypothetical protein